MTFKQANTLIISRFGIWLTPTQLWYFMQEKNLDKEIIEALEIMYNRLCGKF
jgi:hypothetical protein